MNERLVLFVICISIAAAGCAVEGAAFQRVDVAPEQSVVYVYRPYAYGSSELRPAVTCGDDSARIGPGGYHAFVLPYGKVTCTIESMESHDVIELDRDPRVHYVKEEFSWGILTSHPHLDPVDNDVAQAEILKCVQESPQAGQQAGLRN